MNLASYIAENFPLTGAAAMEANLIAYKVAQRDARPLHLVKEELQARIERKRAHHKRTAEDFAELRSITKAEIESCLKKKKRAA